VENQIVTNMWGATAKSQMFAEKLITGVNRDIFGHDGSSPNSVRNDTQSKKGVLVQRKDKHIAVFDEFSGFDVNIWMEDDRDVIFQIYPPRKRAEFPDFDRFLEVVEKPFARVFDSICEAVAEYYSFRATHRVKLLHDPHRRGMDLVEVRLEGLYRVMKWEELLIDVLKLLQKNLKESLH
jgi:hypothetical protein